MTASRPRWTVVALLALGLVLRWNAVAAGFSMDDFGQLAMLAGVYPVERAPWDLFTFSSGDPAEVQRLMDQGSLAWWSDPDLRLSALRPLSSLLTWVDVALFGHAAIGHHLHSVAWWLGLTLGVFFLARVLLGQRVALVTLALYVLDESHAFPLGWVANRNALVSGALGVWGLWAYARLRERGWAPGRWLAPLLFAGACAGGEYALSIAAFLVMYELLGSPGDGRARPGTLAPSLIVFAVYVGLGRALGAGVEGSGVYFDPFREPAAFVAAASSRIPILAGDLTLALPTGRIAFHPELQRVQGVAGLLGIALIAWLVRGVARRMQPDARRHLWWIAVGTLVAMVPVVPSFASSRLLLIPAVGAHLVLGQLFVTVWDHRAHIPPSRRVLLGALAGAHVVLAAAWSYDETRNIRTLNHGTDQAILASEIDDARVDGQRIVVLTAPDPGTLLYPRYIRWVHGKPLPRSWWVLSMAPPAHRLRRLDARTLELTVIDGHMVVGPTERLFRPDEDRLAAGDEVRLDGLLITIEEADAGGPRRVRYRFDRDIDSPELLFLITTPDALRRYPIPPVGHPVELPPSSLPMVR